MVEHATRFSFNFCSLTAVNQQTTWNKAPVKWEKDFFDFRAEFQTLNSTHSIVFDMKWVWIWNNERRKTTYLHFLWNSLIFLNKSLTQFNVEHNWNHFHHPPYLKNKMACWKRGGEWRCWRIIYAQQSVWNKFTMKYKYWLSIFIIATQKERKKLLHSILQCYMLCYLLDWRVKSRLVWLNGKRKIGIGEYNKVLWLR